MTERPFQRDEEDATAPLAGKVALVAGATRGAGRAIAVELSRAGATVYATGRSTRSSPSEYNRPETIEETAELIAAAGGEGIALRVDHLESDQVAALVHRMERAHGLLDILVNDIWGGEKLFDWNANLWEHDLDNGLRLLRLAVETHLVTGHHALPLLVRRPGGLVVEMTDGTAAYNAVNYRVSAFYDLAKASILRLAWSQGHELAEFGATAVALTPGWMRSEMMLENRGVSEANWSEGDPGHFGISETPTYTGRAVAALAADPEVARWNQASISSGQLAQEYGFTDVDGSTPTPGATSSRSRTPANRRIPPATAEGSLAPAREPGAVASCRRRPWHPRTPRRRDSARRARARSHGLRGVGLDGGQRGAVARRSRGCLGG